MTYLWIPAIPIITLWQGEQWVAFEWHGQRHRIVLVTDVWRVDVEWWRGRVWRDYYRLVSDQGYLLVIYQDLLDEKWYLQQLYD